MKIYKLITAIAFLAAAPLSADVPTLGASQLAKKADVVVDVEVGTVYGRTSNRKGLVRTEHVMEAKVLSVRKGAKRVSPGSLIYARYWTAVWRGKGTAPPHASGHNLRPKSGDRFTLHLQLNADRGFDIVLPNGAAPLSP